MKTDPRKACANAAERKLWAWVHDGIAHPFMALTGWSKISLAFHDWTSYQAWPRYNSVEECEVHNRIYGNVMVVFHRESKTYSVYHPRMRHIFGTPANDPFEAVEIAEVWFDSLLSEGYPT